MDLDGRDQAYAPNYQFAVGALFNITERLSRSVDVEGKDEFYLSSRHEEKTDAYELVHARLSYQVADWELSVWGRNLTDEDYIVRGFGSFGNDPRNFYETEPYYQYGEPRLVGATAVYNF